MEWKSFAALKHGRRQVPRLDELERLATLLGVDVVEVVRAATPGGPDAADAAASLRVDVARLPDAVFTLDVDGRIRDCNQALGRMTGRDLGELRERSLLDLVAEASTASTLSCLGALMRDGRTAATELILLHPSGATRVADFHAVPVRDGAGAIVGAQAIARDVTAERRLAGEMNQQRRLLQSVFDALPAACIVVDRDDVIVAANATVDRVCPHGAADLVGKKRSERFGDTADDPVARAFAGGRVEQSLSWAQNRAGQRVCVQRTAGPIFDDGAVRRVVELRVDVTAQLQAGDLRLASLWREPPAAAPATGAAEADGADRRASPRAEADFRIECRAGGRTVAGTVENLSAGGLFVRTQQPLDVGVEVELEWQLPYEPTPVRARAAVAWIRRRGKKPGGFGVRFVEILPPDPSLSGAV